MGDGILIRFGKDGRAVFFVNFFFNKPKHCWIFNQKGEMCAWVRNVPNTVCGKNPLFIQTISINFRSHYLFLLSLPKLIPKKKKVPHFMNMKGISRFFQCHFYDSSKDTKKIFFEAGEKLHFSLIHCRLVTHTFTPAFLILLSTNRKKWLSACIPRNLSVYILCNQRKMRFELRSFLLPFPSSLLFLTSTAAATAKRNHFVIILIFNDSQSTAIFKRMCFIFHFSTLKPTMEDEASHNTKWL